MIILNEPPGARFSPQCDGLNQSVHLTLKGFNLLTHRLARAVIVATAILIASVAYNKGNGKAFQNHSNKGKMPWN